MPLLRLDQIDIAFSGPKLLDAVNLQIDAGDKIGLLGRNGAGKSTLLKIILGEVTPDHGRLDFTPGIRVQSLTQQVPTTLTGSIFEVVAAGLSNLGATLSRYHQLSHELGSNNTPSMLEELHQLESKIENAGGWHFTQQIDRILSRLDLDPDRQFAALSGGLKRRVLLAQALVCEPDVLLLDEPTNHLDLNSIIWLEKFLADYTGALILITHDRAFLQNVANRIVELDRGQLTEYPGRYSSYLEKKAHALVVEQTHNAKFDDKLAQEEVWIRQGIKARRTRNEGRVRALIQLRQQRRQRRETQGSVEISLQKASPSSQCVIEANKLQFAIGDHTIIRNLSLLVDRGDKIGIIGPNGCGKTTLINLLLGTLKPTSGTTKLGQRLEIAYFDQLRSQLDMNLTVAENISQGSDFIQLEGKRKHIIGYCEEFLFTPQQARGGLKALSGGERNRVLLASLFAKPVNFLVLDEPTNDLDLETLEILEQRLVEFTGTVLIVSHDRAFLNNVATSLLVYSGNGEFQEYVGGYDDYLQQSASQPSVTPAPTVPEKVHVKQTTTKNKLSYKEQRELDAIPSLIEALEAEQLQLQQQMLEPEFFQKPEQVIKQVGIRLQEIGVELENAYARWEELENPSS